MVSARWLSNDAIVMENTRGDLLRVDRNGGNRVLLTGDEHNNSHPSGCGDGRYIVFESFRSGDNIWKMDADGSNASRLTNGKGESFPDCSPDGKWVVYLDTSKDFRLWRVSLEGGNPVLLTQTLALPLFRVSPDGNRIAYIATNLQPVPHYVAIVAGADSGQQLSSVDAPPDAVSFSWAPDGRALDFAVTRGDVSNLYRQPLTREPAKQMTNFKSGLIFNFAWSPDGKQLALARGQTGADVVLIAQSK